jgi:MFS family permease
MANRAYTLVCMAVFVQNFAISGVAMQLPGYAEKLGAEGGMVGLAIGIYSISRSVAAIPLGFVSDLIGHRKAIIMSLFLSGAGTALCGLSFNIEQLIAARVVWGLGTAIHFSVFYAILGELFKDERRLRATGWTQNIGRIALFAGAPSAGILMELEGYELGFYCLAIPLFAVALAFIVTGKWEGEGGKGAEEKAQFKPLLNKEIFLVCFLSFLITFGSMAAASSIIPAYARDVGMGKASLGMLGSVRPAGMIAGTIVAIYLAARVGRKRMLSIGFLGIALTLALFPFTETSVSIFVLFMLTGFTFGIPQPILRTTLSDLSSKRTLATANAIFNALYAAGGGLGTIVLCGLAEFGYQPAFYMAAAVSLIAAILTVRLRAPMAQKGRSG